MESRAGSRYEYLTLLDRRLSQTFDAISTESWTYAQMMSFEDLAIRIMGNSSPEGFQHGEAME